MKHLPLALTMGDPAGVGADITLKAWMQHAENSTKLPDFFMIADADHLKFMADRLGLYVPIQKITAPCETGSVFAKALPVLHNPLAISAVPGQPDPTNGEAVIKAIQMAVEFTQNEQASAVVTNPIAKSVLYKAGFEFPGHTEYLAHLASPPCTPVMMLACSKLRVVLATVHVSLQEAISSLNTDTICEVARTTHAALKRDFSIPNPILAIAGLNPHAGEGGAMGREEIDIIAPAIERLRGEGIQVKGPMPPDTMFRADALPTYDAAVCMYHDQGLIPIKALDFESGVNATLGLPFVRTSPDHGTAFDIAGTGRASEFSLMAALTMAHQMAQARAAR